MTYMVEKGEIEITNNKAIDKSKKIIIKKPDCGMNFNCEVTQFDSKLVRHWKKLEHIEHQLKDKLSEEDLGWITQAKLEAEDLVQQFHKEYEIRKS